ncbi:DUF3795 domain-containing protein [Chloroflexota bacterium]
MMIDEKRNLAAPCGLYCGACMIYRINKLGDSELLDGMKEQFIQMFSGIENMQQIPGMPPPAKGFDFSRMQREVKEGRMNLCCEGCLSDLVASHCQNCGFRECAQEKGLASCSQCPDMPCQWLVDFNNDVMPHHGDVLISLERQKEIGIDAWLAEQEERWRCLQCESPLSWYDAECPDCKATQTHTFGSSPFPA